MSALSEQLSRKHGEKMRALFKEMIKDLEDSPEVPKDRITRIVAGSFVITAVSICRERGASMAETTFIVTDAFTDSFLG